ncbi:MAG TPA: type II toxin-antitoxin system VapC family toxin [Gammaproteobacteria bacterium]|nr:type II toxin-antitoxin system VapC family toxin [Gammaproteobacteria bacterium]
MPYLLDTIIISELRRKQRDKQVEQWFHAIPPDDLFLSAISIGEIENGIVKQERINPEFSRDLSLWLENILKHYSDKILPFTTPIAKRWGRLCGELGRADADLMIAATALEHGLIVVTRNISHFEPTGVEVVNPFLGD